MRFIPAAFTIQIPDYHQLGELCGVAEHRQGSVKVDWVERDPSPTALRSPLSPRERAAIFDFLSLSGGRGGTARRWVRGLFADDAFVALYVCGTLDFDGALTPGIGTLLANPFYGTMGVTFRWDHNYEYLGKVLDCGFGK